MTNPTARSECWNCPGAELYYYGLYVWVNYNDLTATSLESWLVREIIPKWPYFRLVNYYNLPRICGVYTTMCSILFLPIIGTLGTFSSFFVGR